MTILPIDEGTGITTVRRLQKLTVAVLATDQEVDAIARRIGDAICADPYHPGACDTPWLMIVTDPDSIDLSEAEHLVAAIDDAGRQH